MSTRILRFVITLWLIMSPLNMTSPSDAAATRRATTRPIEWNDPLVLHPPFSLLSAGTPQTITVQVAPQVLVAGSGATASITATVQDMTGDLVSGVNLGGLITPATLGTISGLGMTDLNGQVTGTWTAGTVIGSGTIEIGDGVVSGTANINLTTGALTTITVVPSTTAVMVGTTTTFTANGFDQYGNAIAITPTWTTNGGTIDDTGVFTAQTAIASGSLVTATYSAISGTALVDITAGPLNSITVTPNPANVTAGATQSFLAHGFDQYGNPVTLTPVWTTNGGSINASTGLFTAQTTVAAGRLVTATQGAIVGTATVNITVGPLDSITVTPNPATVAAGATQSFTANGFDQYGNPVTITPVWTTNGGSINASTGLFTAQTTIAAGRLVTATQGAIIGTATVNIIAGPLNKIIVSPGAVTMTVNTTQTFTASGFDQYNNVVPITPTWSTNGGSIDSSTGFFIAQTTVMAGRLVTATQGAIFDTANVTLLPAAPALLTIQPSTAGISAGQHLTYTAIATDTYGNLIGNVTGSTTFSIAPASGGVFAANVVTPTIKNTWIVTGIIGSAVHTATLTVTQAAFNHLVIENAPAGNGSQVGSVTLSIYNTLTVYAVGYDVYNNLIGNHSANWGGTGVVAGNLAPTTGISTTFTPVVSGTGTITATSGSASDNAGTITVQAPVMRISKIASPNPLTPGSPLQYIIVYTNTGNAAAQNVTITETYPLSTAFFSAIPAPTSGNNVWSLGTLAANDSGSINVFMTTNNQMPVGAVLTNLVQVSAAKVASASYTATTPVNALPDLSASITDLPDPARPGDSLTYSIVYRNDGSAPVTNLRITETYPAQVSFLSANPAPSSGNNVWLASSLNGNGDSRTILVTVRINSPLTDTLVLNNRVVVSAQEAPPYTTTQQTLIVAPHLALAQWAEPLTPTANSLLTYTLFYTNSGSSYAANTFITDALPSNTSFVQCEPSGCGLIGSVVRWNLGQLSAQTSDAVTLTVRVASNLLNGVVITNTARITSTDLVSAMTQLTRTVFSAPGIALAQSDDRSTIAAGQLTTYTLSFNNVGTAPAANVVITDRIPDYTTFVSCSTCTAVGSGVYTFNLGNVSAGQSGNVFISARLAMTLTAGLRVITNTAYIATTTAGDSAEDNWTQDVNDISTRPVLSLRSIYDSSTPYQGKIITYTLRYTNTSAMDTVNVVMTTTRPTWLGGSPAGWTPSNNTDDIRWIGNLAAGRSGSITYVVTLPTTYTLNMNAFVLTFFIEDGGPGGLPKAYDQSLTSIGVPDLSIAQVKVPTTVLSGQKFTATLVISNTGLGRACNPKAPGCGGFTVDVFTAPAIPPQSYPFGWYGDHYTSVPALGPGLAVTVSIANLQFTASQSRVLYFKVDNWDCAALDPCLPSKSQGGLVPEYNELNNVTGPIYLTEFFVRLPLIMKK